MLDQATDSSLVEQIEQLEDLPDRQICCAACAHVLTSEAQQTTVGGMHTHERINPHGYIFEFRTFSTAVGCRAVDAPTREHTWFRGYAWRVTVCGGCGQHVGWRFDSSVSNYFYALITSCITLCENRP